MLLVLTALVILLAFGLLALLAGRRAGLASAFGVAGPAIAAAVALPATIARLATGGSATVNWEWAVPMASLSFRLDAMSAFFATIILVVCALAACYGVQYLWPSRDRKSLGVSWCLFNVLVASMLAVVLADNGVLFLVAWEVMALASFFLVGFEHEKEEVRRACWTYLAATHLGTAFLLPMFLLLGAGRASLDFASIAAVSPTTAAVCFLLAVVGFGTKAGFMPFHVWLPEAHPSAPSHVSAVMSGVMIKTGIFGLLRIVSLLTGAGATVPAWWGLTLIAIGLLGGVLGVLLALAQHDLKRLLAYSSVENIGIIAIGLGVGLLGLSLHSPTLTTLGLAGALLHVLNHAMFKSLLFLGAGAVLHATGTREMDRLGGLAKRMPVTAALWITGAAAICGLPPLNGFVGEFLIYVAALANLKAGGLGALVALLAVVGGLALIGGLAVACFAKAFGVVFLGEGRTDAAAHAHEPGRLMRVPMIALAGACIVIGLAAPAAVAVVRHPVQSICASAEFSSACVFAKDTTPFAVGLLSNITLTSLILIAFVGALVLFRRRLLRGREIGVTGTWDCGYAAPSARMQYSGSSFAQPIVDLFAGVAPTSKHIDPPAGLFPEEASFGSHTPDTFAARLWRPVFRGVEWFAGRFRWIQSGGVHLYVLYIAAAIVVLLVWRLGVGR